MEKRLCAASVICLMIITVSSGFAQDVSDFSELKNSLKQDETINVTKDIAFSEELNVGEEGSNVNITIEGKPEAEGRITLSPNNPDNSKYTHDAFTINKGSSLTLKNITVKNFKGKKGYVFSGAISNLGTLIITAEDNKDVMFTDNAEDRRGGGGDLYLDTDSTTTVNGSGGTVTFNTGIKGTGKLTHEGQSKMIIGGSNSPFRGDFVNESGAFEVKHGASFFEGKSVFKSGELDWYSQYDLRNSSGISYDNVNLTLQDNIILKVGNGNDKANLTLRSNNSSIANTIDITVNSEGTLTLQGIKNLALKKQIKGNGTFAIDAMNLTFDGADALEEHSGIAQSIRFVSKNNSTVNLNNLNNDYSLEAIGGLNSENSALTINIKDYISASSNSESNLTVDGSSIKALNITGNNNKIAGKVTLSGEGEITNDSENLEITNGLKIEKSKDDKFINNKNLTIGGAEGLENNGDFENKGTLKLQGQSNTNKKDATLSNSGTITANKLINEGNINNINSITVQTLENNDGIIEGTESASLITDSIENTASIDMSKSNGEFSATGKVTNSGTIKGQNITFGALENNNNLEANGKLLLNAKGDEYNGDSLLVNSLEGILNAKELEVQGNITNQGKIKTEGVLSTSGLLLNENNASLSFGSANLNDIDNDGTITTSGNINASGKLTNKNNGSISFAGGSLSDIDNSGVITSSGNLSISGGITGSVEDAQIVNNGGTVNVSGDASLYRGKYIQENGSTVVGGIENPNAKLFNGEKEINGGSLSVTSDKLDYNGVVKLGNNTTFNYTTLEKQGGTISDDILKYTGSAATATFKGAQGNDKSSFNLESNITGSQNNNLTIENADLYLSGSSNQYNYNEFNLKNSVLKLGEQYNGNHESIVKNYIFDSFMSDNSALDLNVHIMNDEDNGYLLTDSLTINNNSSGVLNLDNVFISGEENVRKNKKYNTRADEDVIRGEGSLTLSDEGHAIKGATTEFTYDIDVTSDGKSITLDVSGESDAGSLSDMNSEDGERFFQFSEDDNREYHIAESLDPTSSGKFNVTGKNANARDSVLSGKLKKDSQITEEKGSFFAIEEGTNTELSVRNLTVKDADSKIKGGSVLNNNSEDSKILFDNVIIENNSSNSEKGGAVYNNGGNAESHSGDNFSGLYLKSVQFSNNSANADVENAGGAIYNDTNGYLILEDVIVDAANSAAKNDIYNAGDVYAIGSNTFDSEIKNAGHFTFHSDNIEGENGSSIKNFNNDTSGIVIFSGKNTIADIKNNGTANFSGDNTITGTYTNNTSSNAKNSGNLYLNSKMQNNGSFENSGYFEAGQNASVAGSNSSFTNKGGLLLSGDASNYKGTFTQSAKDSESNYSGNVQTNVTGKFFGGTSIINDGILNWLTQNDISNDAKLNVEGGTLNIGDGNTRSGKLTFRAGSSISDNVQTNIYGNGELGIDGANITLGNGSNWLGAVSLNSGSLTLDSIQGNGKLTATSGNLTLKNQTALAVNKNSTIAKDVATDIQEQSSIFIQNDGILSVDSNDKWNGNIIIDNDSTGTLNIDGYNSKSLTRDSGNKNGLLYAASGNVNIKNSSEVTLSKVGENNSIIDRNVVANIEEGSTVNVEDGGFIVLNDGEYADTWDGTVNLNGGTLEYGKSSIDGTLNAEKGNMDLLSGSVLTIKDPSAVHDEVSVNIQKGSTVDIKSGKFNLDSQSNDKWNGLIKNDGGTLTTKGIENSTHSGGALQQSKGSLVLDENSKISITGNDSYIKGGDVSILNNSSLTLAKDVKDFYADNLNMSGNSTFDIKNGEIQSVEAGNVDISGEVNFAFDINPRTKTSDKFIFDNLTSKDNAILNVYDFTFQGGAPIDETVELKLFDGDINGNIEYNTSNALTGTPIGYYGLQSMGGGVYRAYLQSLNPQVYRGQVSTMAAYTHQVMVDDMLTNHFILHEEKFIDNAKNANKYSAGQTLYAPYQNTFENGGLWLKSYLSFNKLDMTQNLNVGSNVWGTLIGADFRAVDLNSNWKFIPTAYIGYNGGHQHYNGVSMYQEGGQAGLMGTFIGHNDFITSITAYGGGYMNDMDVEGFKDNAGNWFTGTALKTAYNLHPVKDFIIQPNAFVSYNLFGKQNWGTDFGVMSMNSGMLNGINAAPGINFILAKDTWSLYLTAQYMFFMNEGIDGMAGHVNLPKVKMDHGYIQYGLGGTKIVKDRLGLYGQVTLRNAGINGVGMQFGLNYMFGIKSSPYKQQHFDRRTMPDSRLILKS